MSYACWRGCSASHTGEEAQSCKDQACAKLVVNQHGFGTYLCHALLPCCCSVPSVLPAHISRPQLKWG